MIMPSDNSWLDAEFDRALDGVLQTAQTHNEAPDPELGHLTPAQTHKLLYTQWGAPESAVHFQTDISLERLEAAPFFRRARWLALAIRDAGSVKATAKWKNLPRKLVTRMVDETLSEDDRSEIWAYNKVVNEDDVAAIHISRIVCEAAGIIHLRKGAFVVPKTRAKLLEPDQAGALYQRLFVAFFQTFNLAYLDRRHTEAPGLQTGVAYTLYRLGTLAKQWYSVDKLATEALLPAVREEIESELNPKTRESVQGVLAWRVLEPLIDWGLLEGKFDHRIHKLIDTLAQVRTTAMYSDILRFEL
jgi:hypothetical protein